MRRGKRKDREKGGRPAKNNLKLRNWAARVEGWGGLSARKEGLDRLRNYIDRNLRLEESRRKGRKGERQKKEEHAY